MSLRQKLADPKFGVAVAGGVIVLALVISMSFGGEDIKTMRSPASYWYYNVETNELYEGPVDAMAPIDDGKGALAYVYTCGACTDGEQYVGYLQKYTDEYKQVMTEKPDDRVAVLAVEDKGNLVREKKGSNWIPANTPAGQKIVADGIKPCPDKKRPKPCFPSYR